MYCIPILGLLLEVSLEVRAQIKIQLSCTQWRRHSRAHAVLPSEVPGVNCTSESVLVQNIGQYGRIPYLFKLIPSFTIFICLSIDFEFVSIKLFAQSKVEREKTFGSRRSTLKNIIDQQLCFGNQLRGILNFFNAPAMHIYTLSVGSY